MRPFSIRGVFLLGFQEACNQLDVDPLPLFEKHNILTRWVGDVNASIPLVNAVTMIEDAAKLTSCPYFGLLMGTHWSFRKLGPYALTVLDSKTFEELLNKFLNYSNNMNEGIHYRFICEDEIATIAIDINATDIVHSIQVIELIISRYLTGIRASLGVAWSPHAVIFRHQNQTDKNSYKNLLKAPVFFEGETDSVVFNVSDLALPLNVSNTELRGHATAYLDSLTSLNKRQLSEKIKMAMFDFYSAGESFDLDRISKLFLIPSRTIQYQLKAEGTNFRNVLAEVQAETALNMLVQKRATIIEVTEILGFSDTSAFSRAFKKWHGYPPSKCY